MDAQITQLREHLGIMHTTYSTQADVKADVKALQTAFFETTETAGEEVQLLRSRIVALAV